MKSYLVGGWVRDHFLRGVAGSDRDWVVVGATHNEMIANGFKKVGASFPVYIHPKSKEEYALARQERKTAPGYHGFSVYSDETVSLEEDLLRRDLTINALAFDPESKELIDPFHGQDDWNANILRHISDAFADDPLRLIRLARFAALFPHMTIAHETIELCRKIVASGELLALPAERISKEIRKMYQTAQCPGRFWIVLEQLGALSVILPEYAAVNVPERLSLAVFNYEKPFLKGVYEFSNAGATWQSVKIKLCLTRAEESILKSLDQLKVLKHLDANSIWQCLHATRALHDHTSLAIAWQIADLSQTSWALIEECINLLKTHPTPLSELELIAPHQRSQYIHEHSIKVLKNHGIN